VYNKQAMTIALVLPVADSSRDFQPISCFISESIQDMTIVTMKDEHELTYDLSNGAVFNDLQRSLT